MNDETEIRSMCPLSHPDGDARSSGRYSLLCDWHFTILDKTVERFAGFEADMNRLITAKTARHDIPPITGSKTPGIDLDDRIANLRYGWIDEIPHAGVHATMVTWTKQVATERSLTLPADNLKTLSHFLRTHHMWIARQDWIGDYADELLLLGRKHHALMTPYDRRLLTNNLMWCREVIADKPCDGYLIAALTPDDPYEKNSNLLYCDTCAFEVPFNDCDDGRGSLLGYARRKIVEAA